MALFGRPTAEDRQRAESWRYWLQSRNPLAIASLVLGIFSLIEFGALLIFGIAGIVLGVTALAQLRRARRASASANGNSNGNGNVAPAPPPGPLRDEPAPLPQPLPYEAPQTLEYEAPQLNIPRVHGHALAWIGIALSAASLVLAAEMYLAPHAYRR
jgi:hypothetical protein